MIGQPKKRIIRGGCLGSSATYPVHLPGGQVRVIGAVPCCAKTCSADHNKKNWSLSLEWRGQSDLFNIHAMQAKRALLPSNPRQGNA